MPDGRRLGRGVWPSPDVPRPDLRRDGPHLTAGLSLRVSPRWSRVCRLSLLEGVRPC